jgi:antitoxin component YwqK of YwqJK toxin-antitoxin module
MEAYKLAMSIKRDIYLIIQLEIPEDAITNMNRKNIVNNDTAKYRTDKAKVMDIYDFCGNNYEEASSIYDKNFCYKKGEIISENTFDKKLENVCTKGIHFFLYENIARNYIYYYTNPENENGLIILFYDNGQVYEEFTVVNGYIDGKRIKYRENGKVHKINYYKKGIKDEMTAEFCN